jgi:hypothetical protein
MLKWININEYCCYLVGQTDLCFSLKQFVVQLRFSTVCSRGALLYCLLFVEWHTGIYESTNKCRGDSDLF